MRIPNKFNGYSADNRRIYNDPTLVVATIANMGSGAAAAATIAEAAAAAAAAEAAATAATAATTAPATAAAEQAAAQAAAQQASQAGIMQGAAVPPPGATPPGVPGLGAPMPPATPLPPAGADQVAYANTGQFNVANSAQPSVDPTAPVELALSPPPGPSVPPAQNLPWSGADQSISTVNNGIASNVYTPPAEPVKNSFLTGVKNAYEAVSKTVKEAPLPFQALGTLAASKQFFTEDSEGPKKDEYKRTPYSGLSPSFASTESGEYRQPGGPSPYLYGFADGGITGPVEQMSNMNAIGGNEMYPMANIPRLEYANPVQQRPISENIMTMGGDAPTDPYTGQLKFSDGGYAEDKKKREAAEQRKHYSELMSGRSGSELENDIAQGQAIANRARGSSAGIIPFDRETQFGTPGVTAKNKLNAMFKGKGIKSYLPKTLDPQSGSTGAGETEFAGGGGVAYGLGGYSDGGRLLKGPGDGVSDSIPATIGNRQPARLADGEFVIPARIVSELGNGSTEAGARQLYAMMERIQKNRKKSVGKGKVAVDSKAKKHLPA